MIDWISGHRAGVAVPVGGGDLRPAPPSVVGHGSVEGRVGEGPHRDVRRLQRPEVDRGRGDDQRDPRVLRLGQADVEVGAQGPGHLLGEPAPDGGAGDPADHLTDQEALGHRVIARGGPRLPPRLLGGQHRRAPVPVGQSLGLEVLGPSGQTGGVAHEVAYLHPFLSGGGELGPVAGHRGIEVELAAVGEHQCAEEGHRLGGRPHVGQRVGLPGRRPGLVDEPAPDVHHRLAPEEDRHRRPHVGPGVEAGRQRRCHPLEPRLPRTLDVSHSLRPLCPPRCGRPIRCSVRCADIDHSTGTVVGAPGAGPGAGRGVGPDPGPGPRPADDGR